MKYESLGSTAGNGSVKRQDDNAPLWKSYQMLGF